MFDVRYDLLKMVQNNTTAYAIAHKFVQDDCNKLTVFQQALAESRNAGSIEQQTSSAVDIAEVRWTVLDISVPEVTTK